MKKAEYRRYTRVGPGGRKCSCCYPAPGTSRRIAERVFKRKYQVAERRAMFQELLELDSEP